MLSAVVLPAALSAVVVGLVVGALVDIGPASGPYRRTIDRGYGALASSVSSESNGTGKALAGFMTEAPKLERLTFFTTLDALSAQAAAQAEELDAAAPPAPDAGAGTGCVSALASRASAVAAIRRALQGLLGGTTGTMPIAVDSAVTGLDSAATTLTQADAQWAACRRALRRAPGTAVVGASRWVTDARTWSPFALTELAEAVAASRTLMARPSLALSAVDLVPAPLPGSGTAKVPSTSRLSVRVDVSNAGNVDEPGIAVRAVLSGPGATTQLSAIVGVGAGHSLTIVLGPFAVAAGSAYTLDISAAPPSGPGAASSSIPLQVLAVPTTTTTTVPPTTTTTLRPGGHSTTTGRS